MNKITLTFLKPGSILSGVLPEGSSATLDASGLPYKSYGSLTIVGFLEIMPNVTIPFSAGSSVVVHKGKLKAIGTAKNPITFKKISKRWAG